MGALWVAHPDMNMPEQVTNHISQNGQYGVGALSARKRGAPGSTGQILSDIAKALRIDAGIPINLEIIALRARSIPVKQARSKQTELVAAKTPTVAAATVTWSGEDPQYSGQRDTCHLADTAH